MALTKLEFTIDVPNARPIDWDWTHAGVVGSGDMEALIRPARHDGRAVCSVTTKIAGYDELWKAVLERFVTTERLGDVEIDINDNAATPPVVLQRLRQALDNARRQ